MSNGARTIPSPPLPPPRGTSDIDIAAHNRRSTSLAKFVRIRSRRFVAVDWFVPSANMQNLIVACDYYDTDYTLTEKIMIILVHESDRGSDAMRAREYARAES